MGISAADIEVHCSCGNISGKIVGVNPRLGNRLVCCCRDCQSFALHLNQESSVLDQYGGTEIVQLPVSHLKITQGIEKIACLRLSETGLYRWYASCCNTPIGNTLGAGAPFIGLIHNFIDPTTHRSDAVWGEIRAYIQLKGALKEVPVEQRGSTIRATLRSLCKLLIWKIKGLNKPSALFNDDGVPVSRPIVVGSN